MNTIFCSITRRTCARHLARYGAAAALVALAACTQGPTPTDPETGLPTPTTYSKSYGGPGFDTAHAVRATADGGSVFVGEANAVAPTSNSASHEGDFRISKLDANGNVEQQRLLGLIRVGQSGLVTEFAKVRVTNDDGYVAVGTTVNDITVARYNAAGVVQWSHTYDSGGWNNYEYPTGQAA